MTGLSTPNDMRAYVKDGTVRSVVLWNAMDLGYLTVQAAEALAADRLKPGATRLAPGRLGEKKIAGADILLGDILISATHDIDWFDF